MDLFKYLYNFGRPSLFLEKAYKKKEHSQIHTYAPYA